MDLALDAWTVDEIQAAHRAAAAGAKVGGMCLGTVVGGGVLVAMFPHLGWTPTFLLVAGLIAFTTWPVLLGRGRHRKSNDAAVRINHVGLIDAFRRPVMIRRLIHLIPLSCTVMMLFNFNRVMLVDMETSLQHIGMTLGVAAPTANLCVSAALPRLLSKYP